MGRDDYENALRLLKKVARIKKPVRSSLYKLLIEMKSRWDARTLNALPDSWTDATKALKANDMGVLQQPSATRSLEWLEENGKCIDHIFSGTSTIDGAGHGAFAKRELPRGTIVTSSPLHHIPNRKIFHLYDYDPETMENGKFLRSDKIIGEQVALNYCFGHSESTLLLCPYGFGVNYLNHNKTRASVKIQWAHHGSTSHDASWLDMTPEGMDWNYKTSLALDFVATRHIAEGEELFLNYGDDWEQAWNEHVTGWSLSDHWGDYVSATQYNALYDSDPLRTVKDQEINPYPENLEIHCHSYLVDEGYRKNPPKVATDRSLRWKIEDKGNPCKILEHNAERNTYTVLITFGNKPKYQVKRTYVMRQSIRFVDVPYSTDMHLVHAFRQPLGIPDSLIPDCWKNGRSVCEETVGESEAKVA